HVHGEHGGTIGRHVELLGREDEVLGAVGGLELVVRQREARNGHPHLALAYGQLCVGIQRDVLAGREGQARRRPERRVESRAAELVVGDASAGGCIKARHGVPPFLPSFPRTTTARALSSRFTTNGASPDRPRGADTVEFPHCASPAAPPSPTTSM